MKLLQDMLLGSLLGVIALPVSAQLYTPSGSGTVVNGTSNVGIGTNSPVEPLHISGPGVAGGELNLLIQNTGLNGARTFLTALPGKSSIQTDMDFTIATNFGGWSDKLILKNSGNLGVGTLYPVTRLHVSGILRIDGTEGGVIGDGSGSRIDLSSGNVTAIEENWGINLIGNDESPVKIRNAALLVGYSSSTPGWGTGGNLLVKGNVGIGTTTPDHKLTVDGGVKCEEVLVEVFTGAGPDYVFEKDYNLLSLAELEAYINANKHLPEVPSAKDMEANGLHLKEMNLLLLKKVEELTLHLIEANKKIDETNLKVKVLEAQMKDR